MKEGTRVYLYEAYMVILASGIIGLVIGIIGACLVNS
jgi:hypothetical protein